MCCSCDVTVVVSVIDAAVTVVDIVAVVTVVEALLSLLWFPLLVLSLVEVAITVAIIVTFLLSFAVVSVDPGQPLSVDGSSDTVVVTLGFR